MKTLIINTLLCFSFFVVTSCSKKEIRQETNQNQATTIQNNRSLVVAKILSVQKKSNTDYTLKLRLIEVNEDQNFPSLAAGGDEIIVIPNFYLDDKGNINDQDDRNKKLISLAGKKDGDTVNLILTFELKKGWLILNVIN